MKCYFGGSSYPGSHIYVEACFANSHKEAKKILWRDGSELAHECDGNYFDLRVKRHEMFDNLYDKSKTEAYVVNDDKTLREMGWLCDGDSSCAKCGLYTLDNKFPLNDHSLCEDCGERSK